MAKKAIVRGPDGKVYIVSKTAPPHQLSDEDTQKITKILEDRKKEFENILNNDISAVISLGCGHNLNLTIPDVSIE
jgi:hypothetical protein